MVKKILVSGASGYIGSHLIRQLLREDAHVVALTRSVARLPAWLLGTPEVEVVEGDLSNKKSLKKAIEGVSIVFHLAAALRTFEKNSELYQTNIAGLKNLLITCQETDRPIKFIFASSVDAGQSESDYAKSKLEGEKIVKEFCRQEPKIEYIIVKIGHVFDDKEGVVIGIKEIINQNTWQSAILYHCLGDKLLYPLEIKSLVKKLIPLAQNSRWRNKPLTLCDEKLTVRELIAHFKQQKIIEDYPRELPFGGTILKIWQILGKILRRADLLVYLSLQK